MNIYSKRCLYAGMLVFVLSLTAADIGWEMDPWDESSEYTNITSVPGNCFLNNVAITAPQSLLEPFLYDEELLPHGHGSLSEAQPDLGYIIPNYEEQDGVESISSMTTMFMSNQSTLLQEELAIVQAQPCYVVPPTVAAPLAKRLTLVRRNNATLNSVKAVLPDNSEVVDEVVPSRKKRSRNEVMVHASDDEQEPANKKPWELWKPDAQWQVGENGYKCTQCKFVNRMRSLAWKHDRTDTHRNATGQPLIPTSQRRHQCGSMGCDYGTDCDRQIKSHQLSHKKGTLEKDEHPCNVWEPNEQQWRFSKKRYKCVLCGPTFEDKVHAWIHYRTNGHRKAAGEPLIPDNARLYQCDWGECSKGFDLKSDINKHQKSHIKKGSKATNQK